MKNLLLLLFLIGSMSFNFVPVRTVSASTTIVSGDDTGYVVNTGGAVTFTFGTVSAGFTCTISNHGTGNVTFSGPVTVANGTTITVLPKGATEFLPNVKGNSINLLYDGSVWRGN